MSSASITLPALELYGGDVDWQGSADLELPALTSSADASQGSGISAAIELPLFELDAAMGAVASIGLPALELAAESYEQIQGGATLYLPIFELAAEGGAVRDGTAEITLPGFVLAASVVTGAIASASLTLPPFRMEAQGEDGENGTASIELPVFELAALSGEPIVGTAALTLPFLYVDGHGYTSPADVWRTWTMNLQNKAVTEYTNFEFTSYMVFGGKVYGSNANGIYELNTSDLDGATEIAASVLTGVYDFEDSHMKRVPRVYVDGKMNGDLKFKTVVTIGGERAYLLPYDGATSVRTRRVPIGRGPRSVRWQFGIENIRGAYFETVKILVHPEVMRRRVF